MDSQVSSRVSWGAFEQACEALRTYTPRLQALEYIRQGSLDAYGQWARFEGYEAGFGTGEHYPWDEYAVGTTGYEQAQPSAQQWYARLLFSPIPIDAALVNRAPELPGSYWSNTADAAFVERMQALLRRMSGIASWGQTPFEIALRTASAQAFEALVRPVLGQRLSWYPWIYADEESLNVTCKLHAHVRALELWLARPARPARTRFDTQQLDWRSAVSFSGFFVVLSQALGCEHKAALARQLFDPADFASAQVFGAGGVHDHALQGLLVQAIAQVDAPQAQQALERCARYTQLDAPLQAAVQSQLSEAMPLQAQSQAHLHLQALIGQGAMLAHPTWYVEQALERGDEMLARVITQSMPIRWAGPKDDAQLRARLQALYELWHLDQQVAAQGNTTRRPWAGGL